MEIEDVVLRARVPLIKLHLYLDQRQKQIISYSQYKQLTAQNQSKPPNYVHMISVDMCINNVLPVQNTRLIKAYCNYSPMTRPLVMFVKHWATKRELN